MNKVIAKFYCGVAQEEQKPQNTWVGPGTDGKGEYKEITPLNVNLYAVTANQNDPQASDEDKAFAFSTPSGNMSMRIMNDAIREAGFFEAGKNYKITIERVD